ncbi:ribbon-helix-helix domain-containing protein [Beijerinckia indica]|uniref:Ribbon-helix-helix domain-containing protein n=1 Tax=Beijerinckia indica subsp. indica (strain ATCC 9039 / DSM 1715 / NCIMB 8712) TaxID=395963 RepID=B2IEK6_BEII9|nr:ribbon-helix-helix domain-containing protein [Beijerinckia indica]ACB96948.1 conserved hypothetical protein [Beijerinckia indica subsp. indica ATCC 9039]
MCKISQELEAASYICQTRSIRLGGHVTSIRLETLFWRILEEIAALEGTSLGRFLTKLHDDSLEFRDGIGNFTAYLRCACIYHVATRRERAHQESHKEPVPETTLMPLAARGNARIKTFEPYPA